VTLLYWLAGLVALLVCGIELADVEALIGQYTKGRTFGVLGEPRVNALLLDGKP
jgi:K+-transporting ATPase c subunit